METIVALSTVNSTVELSQKWLPTFSKLIRLLKNGKISIAVFGAGGTGKSTLGKFLSSQSVYRSDLLAYQESIAIEDYKLSSDLFGSIVIAPGQERRQDTWGQMLKAVSAGKISLVFNVVSFGYHSFQDIKYSEHRLYQLGMNPESFLEIYLEDRRDREIYALKRIEPHFFASSPKKTMIITLITKQDLWWSQRQDVASYYRNGQYSSLIEAIRRRIGSDNFMHEVISTSFTLENFVSGDGELLAPVASGYDERLRLANLNKLIDLVESCLGTSLSIGGT